MSVQIKTNELVTNLLNEWYKTIRSRHIANCNKLKIEIDGKINNIDQDQELLLYYSLLNFRHQYLMDHLSIGKESFKDIESFPTPTDGLLVYYYHFFKAIHATITGNYKLAQELYDIAENKLQAIPDPLEHAEFYFTLSTFSCHNQQYVLALRQSSMAQVIFSKHEGYELNIGYCKNVSGLACIHLKEYPLAEEYLITAMDIFKKYNEEHAKSSVRHNLGFMYASQNLSELAIKQLSELIKEHPNNYKAIFIKAREHFKLKNTEQANILIDKGLKICKELQQEDFHHRLAILKALNNNVSAEKLEKVVNNGMSYFENEQLYENIDTYCDALATKFYEEDNDSKASKYFYQSSQARKKAFEKGALK
ncbi:tetratricopeptide repeat protein [Bacillus thuringiensis]|uniref:response regulator aspartate phosphatase n=1 Tax=Bacillus thuringiensis TaxID=1428 RepID=UPI00333C0E1A